MILILPWVSSSTCTKVMVCFRKSWVNVKKVCFSPFNESRTYCRHILYRVLTIYVFYTVTVVFRVCLHTHCPTILIKYWRNCSWATWAAHRGTTTLSGKSDPLWWTAVWWWGVFDAGLHQWPCFGQVSVTACSRICSLYCVFRRN